MHPVFRLFLGSCFYLVIQVDGICLSHWCHRHGHCEGIGDDAYCVCDIGYTSSDHGECDMKICPKGDDPSTNNQNYREISITTGIDDNDGEIQGILQFGWNGEKIAVTANANHLREVDFAASLLNMKSIEHVGVTQIEINEKTGGGTYVITYMKFPTVPYENNIFSHSGNPALSSFSCDASEMTSISSSTGKHSRPYCILQDVTNSNLREYVSCSNHGKCNQRTGICECDLGWKGNACDNDRDDEDIEVFAANGPSFTGSVMKLKARRQPNDAFDFVNAVTGRNEEKIFSLSGNGDVSMQKGNLYVQSGSVVVNDGIGLDIHSLSESHSISVSSKTDVALFHGFGEDFESSVIDLSVNRTSSADFRFIRATSSSKDEIMFEVDGRGVIKSAGGIEIGNVIDAVQFTSETPQIITPKAIIGTGGVQMKGGSFNITDGDIAMNGSGGIFVNNGSSSLRSNDRSSTLTIARDVPPEMNSSATVLIEQCTGSGHSSIPHIEAVTDGITVLKIGSSGELNTHGGISVESGGIHVKSGGLEVQSGGIKVNGGLQLNSGSLKLENYTDGLYLSGGGVQSITKMTTTPSFVGKAQNKHFQGNIMNLIGPMESLDESESSGYNFIEASQTPYHSSEDRITKDIFKLTSKGDIITNGKIISDSGITCHGHISMKGGANIQRMRVTASKAIIVDDISNVSFLEIIDDGIQEENEINLNGTPIMGQMLFIMNNDQDAVSGSGLGKIPPSTLVLFLYSEPNGWIDVTALAAHQRSLKGVTAFEAENDLDIGAHALSSKRFHMTSKDAQENNGELTFFGPGGTLMGDNGMKFDQSSKTLKVARLRADEFAGNVLDFRGGTLINAALVNATVDKLHHLTVRSIGVLNAASGVTGGKRMAIIDEKGVLKSVKHIRWDEKKEELKLPSISSFSSQGIKVRSDLDMMSNTLHNVKIARETTLEKLIFSDGTIQNTILKNVTASDLKLGSVEMKSVSLAEFAPFSDSGKVIEIGEGGKLVASEYFQNIEGILSINTDVQLMGEKFDFKGGNIINAHMTSGSVKGTDIEIEAHSLVAESISLSTIKRNKKLVGDSLLIVDEEGNLKRGMIASFDDGSIGDFKVVGQIDFRHLKASPEIEQKSGILGALIDGGEIKNLQGLEVIGESSLSETFIGGSLTVSGSVLGSGPYVDVSDSRLKKNINSLKPSTALNKLMKMNGVTYELDRNMRVPKALKGSRDYYSQKPKSERKEIGFIAQEVEKEFPELVETMEDGYKGVQYARFVPVIVEAMKEISAELHRMEEMQDMLLAENKVLRAEIARLGPKATLDQK